MHMIEKYSLCANHSSYVILWQDLKCRNVGTTSQKDKVPHQKRKSHFDNFHKQLKSMFDAGDERDVGIIWNDFWVSHPLSFTTARVPWSRRSMHNGCHTGIEFAEQWCTNKIANNNVTWKNCDSHFSVLNLEKPKRPNSKLYLNAIWHCASLSVRPQLGGPCPPSCTRGFLRCSDVFA